MLDSKIRDIIIRAVKTFWQAALASLMVAIPNIIDLIPVGWVAMKPVLVSAGVGALAAGLSAVYNGVIAPWVEKLKYRQAVEVEVVENGGEAPVDESK